MSILMSWWTQVRSRTEPLEGGYHRIQVTTPAYFIIQLVSSMFHSKKHLDTYKHCGKATNSAML